MIHILFCADGTGNKRPCVFIRATVTLIIPHRARSTLLLKADVRVIEWIPINL